MKVLTDLMATKKIAEIEGYKLSADGTHLINSFYSVDPFWPSKEAKALVWDLLIKHDIDLTKDFHGMYSACIEPNYSFVKEVDGYEYEGYDQNPVKAIFLVIIEATANNTKSN